MKKEKDKKIVQEANSSCGCGDNCTCGDNCNCTEDNKCNENCTCGEKKNEKSCKHDNPDCNCSDECNCSDDCHCDEHCDCGCEHEHGDRAEEFKAYQEVFKQFEEALEKIDRELTLEKARADKNEHLADSYKKDLDRYKERNKNIEYESKRTAAIELANKLLPVLDNFAQALKTVKDENVMVGFRMIESGMKNILQDMGIVEINAENMYFSPDYHDAVNIIKTNDEKLDGKVSSVYKKGYKLADDSKVIRHAQVEIYKF